MRLFYETGGRIRNSWHSSASQTGRYSCDVNYEITVPESRVSKLCVLRKQQDTAKMQMRVAITTYDYRSLAKRSRKKFRDGAVVPFE
jgi:hypothetical protein